MNHESVALIGEPKCNKLKFFPATAIMVASMTGVGVLAFPNTFVNAGGCLEGVFFQLPFLFMAWVTLIAIGMVVKRHNVDEYEEMIISMNDEIEPNHLNKYDFQAFSEIKLVKSVASFCLFTAWEIALLTI